ncbi:MAG: glycosyltransferase family 4 protein [Lachnospiraceae bacterium]|nr:glycosyltransferase family 4 protein [Lachnospiraceae bacterium]
MNIGIFTDTYYPEINGVASSTYELKKGLEKLGHSVTIFTVTNPAATKQEKQVYRITSVPFPMLKERRIGVTLSKIWEQKIKKLHLDVIHTQTEFIMGHLGKKMADRLGIPHIHTYHTIYEDYLSYLHMPDKQCFRKIVQHFSRICCNRADEIIVPTEKVENLLGQYGVTSQVHVIPSGISLPKFANPNIDHVEELKRQLNISDDKMVLLYVGRLSAEKNIAELLSYVHKTGQQGEITFLLVGDGPEREALEQQVQRLHLESSVIFTGMVPFDQIEDYYALGNIFVSASTSETQGLTYIEALASGMPLLVRQDDCLDGILRDYENGIGYEDEETFRQGFRFLNTAIRQNPRFSQKTIRKSVSSLGQSTFALQVEKIYQNRMIKQDVSQNEENHGTIHAA